MVVLSHDCAKSVSYFLFLHQIPPATRMAGDVGFKKGVRTLWALAGCGGLLESDLARWPWLGGPFWSMNR